MRKTDGRGTELTRLVLVFALDLENVEKVGGGRVHLDEVLVVLGHGVWDVRDLEVRGALGGECQWPSGV